MESFQIERSPDLLARFDGPLRDNGKINGKGKGGRKREKHPRNKFWTTALIVIYVFGNTIDKIDHNYDNTDWVL